MKYSGGFMHKVFRKIFIISIIGLAITLITSAWLIISAVRGTLIPRFIIISAVCLFFGLFLNLYLIIPCICDFKYILKNEYPEEDVMVVESDTSHKYSQEYCLETRLNSPINGLIVTRMKEFEPMKCYKVRYLPKTKIIEVISCTGNIFK